MSEPTPTFLGQTVDPAPAVPRDGLAGAPCVPGHEVLEWLGEGGMGVVYKARQLAADRIVALKAVRAGGHDDAAALARFRNEARGVARLQHPNIIQIHEVGESDGLPYFTMEYCPGGGLDRKLAGTPLPPKEAAALVEALARAVQTAHDNHLIHRDLKPANVLFAADGAPKITDFGLAKQLDDAADPTVSRAVVGTPSYMAPEQTLGKAGAAGPAADVYALGAVLYECLTGRPPFKAATAVDTLLLVRSEEPAAPSQLQPKTPHDLETICLKCLRKEPQQRYATASALAEDLRRFRGDEPILARPVRTAERLLKWARRRPAVAALLGGLIAALAAGTAVSTYFGAEAGRHAHDADASAGQARGNEKIARDRTIFIRDRAEAANLARQAAEATTARGLLRTLGARPEGLAEDVEMDALWELAESRSDSARLRFLDEALRSPESAWKLANRRDLAFHAAVGLDSDRRRQAEEKLLAVLRDDQAAPGLRAHCVLMGLSMGGCGPEFARDGAHALVDAMARGRPLLPSPLPNARPVLLAPLLTVLAKRLDHDSATDEARALTKAMSGTADPVALGALATGLAPVLDRLPPDEQAGPAGDAARVLTKAMSGAADPNALSALASGLAAVLDRLPPGERAGPAGEAARALADAMTTAEGQKPPAAALASSLSLLTRSLAAMLDRLPPGEGVGLAHDAARALTSALNKAPSQVQKEYELREAAEGLAAMSGRLDAAAAADAAHAVIGARSRTTNPFVLTALDAALTAVLGRLSPEQRTKATHDIARALADALVKDPSQVNEVMDLTRRMTALADELNGDAAADAVRALADAMTRSPNDYQRNLLAQALQPLVARLDADHATALAHSLAEALPKATNAASQGAMAQALSVVLDRLPPDEAARTAGAAAQTLADALCNSDAHPKPNDPIQAPSALAIGFVAVAKRLGEGEEAAYARRMADAVTRTPNPYAVLGLVQALGAVSGRLTSEDASSVAEALAVVMAARPDYAQYQGRTSMAAPNFAAVCTHLDPADAAFIARALADAMARNPGIPDSTMKAAAARLDHDGATTVAKALAAAMAKAADPAQTGAFARALAAVLADLPPDEAVPRARDAARAAADAMKKTAHDMALADPLKNPAYTYTTALGSLASGLGALLERLPPDEAAPLAKDAAQTLADAMKKTKEMVVLSNLAPLLAAVLERLPPDDAAPLAREAARTLAEAMKKATDVNALTVLASGLAAVLPRLPRGEAGPLAKNAVRALADRLKTAKATELDSLKTGLTALAPRPDHEDAVLIVRAAANAVANALADANTPQFTRQPIVKGLTDMASQWGQDGAAAAAEAVSDVADPNTAAFAPLAEALAGLVARLEPDQIPAKAPRQLAEAMTQATDQNVLGDLRKGLEASTARLDHDGAAALARQMADAMTTKPEMEGVEQLAHALGVVLDRLPPAEAAPMARKVALVLTDVWKKKSESTFGRGDIVDYRPTGALLLASARTNGLEEDERFRFLAVSFPVQRTVALMGLSYSPFAAVPLLALESQPPRSRLSTQELVDLLKRPNCIGASRDVILLELRGQCGRPFDDVWDFVEWAEKNRPDLDLKSPPRRDQP